MEVKTLVHTMVWLVVDGIALTVVLHVFTGMLGGGQLTGAMELAARALCG